MDDEKVVLDRDDMRRTLVRIAHEIVEKNATSDRAASRSSASTAAARILAARLHAPRRATCSSAEVPLGDLDITFYRDDLGRRAEAPVVHATPPRLRRRRAARS